jgi:hypothetical protein
LNRLDVVAVGGNWVIEAEASPKKTAATSALASTIDPTEWPTGSSSSDPIPIKWFKPHSGLYPTLRIGTDGAERTPLQGVRLPAVDRTPERLLKVSKYVSVDDPLSRKDRGSENVKEQVRDHLEKLRALHYSTGNKAYCDDFAPDYAIDHVRDLTWKGDDLLTNLWPLRSDRNNAINASHNQRVRVKKGNDTEVKAASQFGNKHFIVKKVATTVPSSAGDHGTDDDRPINGQTGIPKKI